METREVGTVVQDTRWKRYNGIGFHQEKCLAVSVLDSCGSANLALELLNAGNIGPFEVVKDTCPMQEDIASVLEFSCRAVRLRFAKLDQPFSLLLFPVASDNFCVEGHEPAEIPDLTDLVEVFPDVGGVGEKARPVGL